MKRLLGSWFFILIMLAVDFYVFQSLRVVTSSLSPKARMTIHMIYWSFTVAALLLFITISFIGFEKLPQVVRSLVFPIVIGLFIAKIVATLFFLLDDVRRIFQWGGGKAISVINGSASNAEGITRSVFLSWLGIGVGGGLFGTLLYGFGNKYKYRVEKVKLTFENLPSAFKGLKIIQISDIHSGSLEDKLAVEKGVRKLMEQEPDLVFFTGDLVNNVATEMDGFID
ncbi:MAG: hypothetical protein RJB31_1191, partial [Bacteroidota bacterium]